MRQSSLSDIKLHCKTKIYTYKYIEIPFAEKFNKRKPNQTKKTPFGSFPSNPNTDHPFPNPVQYPETLIFKISFHFHFVNIFILYINEESLF